MEVHFRPETETRLQELAVTSGHAPDDLVEEALAGYLEAMTQVWETLDSRYDDVKNGRVEPIDGEAFFEGLRKRGKSCAGCAERNDEDAPGYTPSPRGGTRCHGNLILHCLG